MFQIKYLLFLTFIMECYARDALKYFIDQKKILNTSFTVLTNFQSTNVIWVEYKYSYETDHSKESSKMDTVNVGVFNSDNCPFDCNIDTDKKSYQGYSIEIIKLLQERLNFRINYVLFNNSLTNIRKDFISHKIDILLCHPEIDFQQESEIIQLHPTLGTDYILIYKPDKLHLTKDIFILTFSGTLWLCFLILLVTIAICMHVSTKQYSIIYSKSKYQKWSWVEITLWINAAACQQGLSYTPNGYASRTIFFLGYLISYLLYTGFAAGITSLLLKQTMNNKLTLKDVETKRFTTAFLSQVPIMRHTRPFVNKTLLVPHIEDLFVLIDQDNTVGIAPKLFIDQYFARNFNYEMISSYAIVVLKELSYKAGFAVLKSSKYKYTFNQELIALQELGLLTNVLQFSLLPKSELIVKSNYSSARIEHVGSAILILLVGTLSSTVFLVAELTIAVYQSRVQDHTIPLF